MKNNKRLLISFAINIEYLAPEILYPSQTVVMT